MMSFTAAYFLRLAVWALVLAGLLGGPVWISWYIWDRALRRVHAAVRFRVACGHFVAVLAIPAALIAFVHLKMISMGGEILREPPRTGLSAGDGPITQWMVLFFLSTWLAGALLAMIRLAIEAWQLARVPSRPAPAAFAAEVRFLASRTRVRRELRVRIADVPVPQVAGCARPILLVPASLADLPAAGREAVLLHELAHVERRDFAVNLLQRVVLVVLWFQPAAWALYHSLSREREACCDQLAVTRGASAPALARALVRLAESRLPRAVAMAAAGGEDLSWRVNLLLAPETILPRSRSWFGTGLGLLALACSALGGAKLPSADEAITDLYIASDIGPAVAINARDPAGSFGLQIRQGQVIGATVGNRQVAQANILQRGERVTLLGASKEPVVSFRVTPFGRIAWRARVAQMPRS